MNFVYNILSGILFRIRGGLRIPGTNKKFPLCKCYFALWFAIFYTILKGFNLQTFIIMFIASRMATQIAGWGEAVGCALGIGKPDPNRHDYLDFDEFCDNFHIGNWKLIDHPQLYGVIWLTLRGILLTFLIGLATNSVWYIIWGAPMGIIYWLCGLFARKIKNDGKGGWYYSEYVYGFYLSIGSFLW